MEETKMSEVVSEIQGASEEELREVIEKWFEDTRTQGMHIGAQFISAAVLGAINKHLTKGLYSSSLRDLQRALKRVIEIVSVQLKQDTVQNDLATEEAAEEAAND